MAAYELKYTAEEIDGILESVDEKTIYGDATQSEHGLMSVEDKTKLDALPTAQQIEGSLSEKTDRVSNATNGNFAGLDSNGNLTDSGKKASDFATPSDIETAFENYSPTFVCSYGVTTFAEISYAYKSGKRILVDRGGRIYELYLILRNRECSFFRIQQNNANYIVIYKIAVTSNDEWSEENIILEDTADKVSTIVGNETNETKYPNTKAVADALADYVQKSQTVGLLKNDGTVDTTQYGTYSKPSGGIPASDLESSVQTSLGKADTALQSFTETDPTVPSWAKQPNKPSYSYSEISNTPDLSGFITKSVNDLTNYYLKSETYTQAEVNALIGAIQQFHYEIYPTLPASGESNVLYLIGPTGSGADKYEEYVYSNNTFTKIGDTSIDLSGYVTIRALNTALASYTPISDLATVATSGDYDDLTNKPTIPIIPTISTDIASDKADNTKTAGAKAVYDAIHPAYASSQPQDGMLPNVLYKLGTLSGSVTIAFATPSDNTIENEYKFTFTADSTAPTITWPQSVTSWIGNSIDNGAPKVEADTYYEVSVLDGCGIFNKF